MLPLTLSVYAGIALGVCLVVWLILVAFRRVRALKPATIDGVDGYRCTECAMTASSVWPMLRHAHETGHGLTPS